MSAHIIPFPRRSPVRALCAPREAIVTPFSTEWCAQHIPLIEAGVELLSADDAELARWCALMRDAGGRAMLDELAGQLQRLGICIAAVGNALGLTAARIREDMTARA